MPNFETISLADGLILQGQHWPVDDPLAAVSLVHGFGEHCGRYEELATELVANQIAVVGVDLRGHGKTIGPRGVAETYDHLHDDLKTLLKQTESLYPTVPHFLFGHSMGGGLVLHHGFSAGEDDPLAGYLVSAPLIRITRRIPGVARLVVKKISTVFPKTTVPIPVSGERISSIPVEQKRYDNDPLNHNRLGFRLAVGLVETGERLLHEAAEWNEPLCLWHSKADQINDYEATRQFAVKAKRCEFTSFEDVEHEMHQDTTRAEVHQLMTQFILSSVRS